MQNTKLHASMLASPTLPLCAAGAPPLHPHGVHRETPLGDGGDALVSSPLANHKRAADRALRTALPRKKSHSLHRQVPPSVPSTPDDFADPPKSPPTVPHLLPVRRAAQASTQGHKSPEKC